MFKVGITCILIKENKMLLGKRKNIFGSGQWGLPGGHLEFGEKLAEAASRELKEETGIESKNIEFLGIVNDGRKDSHYIHVSFIVKDWNGDPQNMEPDKCEGFEWFNLESLPENIFFPHKGVIHSYINKLNIYEQNN